MSGLLLVNMYYLRGGAHLCPEPVKIQKIPQHQKYHSIVNYHIVNNFNGIWQINLIGLLRYGHPDVQFLATLKIKLQIYRFLNIPNKNLESNLIFRVAIHLQIEKLAHIWEP